jgi:hypothetical protein
MLLWLRGHLDGELISQMCDLLFTMIFPSLRKVIIKKQVERVAMEAKVIVSAYSLLYKDVEN